MSVYLGWYWSRNIDVTTNDTLGLLSIPFLILTFDERLYKLNTENKFVNEIRKMIKNFCENEIFGFSYEKSNIGLSLSPWFIKW